MSKCTWNHGDGGRGEHKVKDDRWVIHRDILMGEMACPKL